MCIGIVTNANVNYASKCKIPTKLKFIAQFCRLAMYGYILRSNTVGNRLRWDSYGRYVYLEFIRATSISITDLTLSWFAVCEARSRLPIRPTSALHKWSVY